MVGRFPIIALFITVDPEDVDVNVHPAKAEVRFKNPDRIIGGVHRAVRRGLVTQSPVPELNTPTAWPSYRQDSLPKFDPNGQGVPVSQPLWRSNLENNAGVFPSAAAVDTDRLQSEEGPAKPASAPPPPVYQPFMPQTTSVPQTNANTLPQEPVPASPENVSNSLPVSAYQHPAETKSSAPFFPILRWIGQIGST